MFLSSLLVANAIDVFEPIAKWATLGMLTALIALGIVLYCCKRKAFQAFIKPAIFTFIAYLLAVAVLLFALDIAKHYSDSYTQENWLDKRMLITHMLLPLLILCSVTLLWLISYTLTKNKTVGIIGAILCTVALVATLILLTIYYDKKIANDGYYNSETASVQQIALYIGAVLAIGVIVGLACLDKQKLLFDARTLAYAGICVAMSFSLSYIKLWDMPQGGSITLVSLLPVMLFSYLFGAKRGVFVGFIYGVLQAVQDPWLIHPAQFLLDYPVAFASAGLAGLFRSLNVFSSASQAQFTVSALLAGVLRFVCHLLSGVFAFSVAAQGQNVWIYSLIYNSYVFVDIALVLIAGAILLSSKAFNKAVVSTNRQ